MNDYCLVCFSCFCVLQFKPDLYVHPINIILILRDTDQFKPDLYVHPINIILILRDTDQFYVWVV